MESLRRDLLRHGAAVFHPEATVEWRAWLARASNLVAECVTDWVLWDDKTRRQDFSIDDLWVNVNKIERDGIRDFPAGAARDLISGIVGEVSFPPAQVTVLLPGYPAGAPGIGRDARAFLEHGNLHIDGSGTKSPAGLIVGVLISDIRAGVCSGQPLHVPGSHRRMIEALRDIAGYGDFQGTEFTTQQIRGVVERLRHDNGSTAALFGQAGTVYLYHGALIHGMAANSPSWPRRREAIYFRFPYPNGVPGDPGRFLGAVRAGWRMPGLEPI